MSACFNGITNSSLTRKPDVDAPTNVTVTVLPGCSLDKACMLVEVELTPHLGLNKNSKNDNNTVHVSDEEKLQQKKDEEKIYIEAKLIDPSETDPERIKQIKAWRAMSAISAYPLSMSFALDHVTNDILDACLTADVKPLDETVTLTLEQIRKNKEKEMEETKKKQEDNKEEGKEENDNDDNAVGEEKKKSKDDGDDDVKPKEEKEEETTQKANEVSPKTSPLPVALALSSTKPKPHAPCLLLRGDFRLQAKPGALGIGLHPVHVAALCGNLKGLRKFVETYGADALKVRTDDNRDIVEYAIRGHDLDVVKFLVDECKIPFDTPNGVGSTNLMTVCFAGGKTSNEIAAYLIKNFTAEQLNVHYSQKEGECALLWALMGANWDIADLLMEVHQAKLPETVDVVSSLQQFAARNNVEGIRYFLEKLGVRLDYPPQTPDSVHPMVIPSQSKSEDVALAIFDVMKPFYIEQVMKKEGYDEDYTNVRKKDPKKTYDLTPVHFAARQGYVWLCKALHELGLATTSEQLNAVSTYVGSAFLYGMTPVAVSNVILYLLYLGVNPGSNDYKFRTPLIARLVFWDGRASLFKGKEKETDPWLRCLTYGDEFHCLIVHLIKDRKLLNVGISSGEGPLFNPTFESLRREQDEIVAHARKHRRLDPFALNRNFLPFQGTLVDPQFTSGSCTLATGLFFIDAGLDYANTRVMNVVGNTSQHTLRFHELKAHWLRYYYYFLSGGGFSSLACGDATSDDLSWSSNPQTVYLACKVYCENADRITRQEREAEKMKGMSKKELEVFLAEKKKQNITDLAVHYVDRKAAQIVSTVRYYRAHTTTLGRIVSCQSSFKSGGGGGLLMSWDGVVQYVQDRISAFVVGWVHQKSTTLLRNPNRWSSHLERFANREEEKKFFEETFFSGHQTKTSHETS